MSTDHLPAASPWRDGLGRAGIRAAQVLLLLTLLAVSVYGLMQIRLVVIPVLLALILAAAIGPLVNWLRRRGWPGAAATGVSFLLLLGVLGGVVTGIVLAVKSEADELVRSANKGFDQLYGYIQHGPLPIDQKQLDDGRDALIDFVTSSAAGTRAVSGLTAAGEFLTGALLMAVILFFFLKDGDRIWAFMLRGFSGERLVKARRVGTRSLEVLGGYVRGTAIIALVDSLLIGLALFLLNVPLAIPLAVIVFIGSFIPLVGATVAGALAALVALVANGPFVALMVVIAVIGINQLEGNFLQPQVMSKSLDVHALVILLALAAGTILAGIVGAILSVPVAAVTWAAIKVWTGEDADQPPADQPAEIAQAEQDTAADARGLGEAPEPGSGGRQAGEPGEPGDAP
jgi:predicted PurR-regulated permease PerM